MFHYMFSIELKGLEIDFYIWPFIDVYAADII